ncbi:MAG: hypothetical protein JEY79_03490 [Pseudodesulfovibrio sp.]|nr:hypothetical protein [Pseudodesulfovibrio sp.]
MKYLTLIGILLVGAFVLFNSNWFQAFFLYEHFYEKIYCAPFDVTKKGESIIIPIQFKYNTSYGLALSVPDRYALDSLKKDNGQIKYRFISKGHVLKEGMTIPPIRENTTFTNNTSSVDILIFDLPLPGAEKDLTLELVVLSPMTFFNDYSGLITCFINPYYNPD